MNWKRALEWVGIVVLVLLGVVVLVAGFQIASFANSASRVYDVPPLTISASTDPAIIDRGRHLAEIMGCTACHGSQLEGAPGDDLGPIGVMNAPNLTTGRGGVGTEYSDGELARAIKHGIRNNGRTVMFMPSTEFNWLPDGELTALVSFVRSLPGVDNAAPPPTIGPLGKILNQFGVIPLTIADRIDHNAPAPNVPAPEPTAKYGFFLARGCIGCHGENFSGGKIPGAPGTLPIPANLTPHETGLAGWSYEDFVTTVTTGVRPDGRRLDPFMPVEVFKAMNDIELGAYWAYLTSLAPLEFGNR